MAAKIASSRGNTEETNRIDEFKVAGLEIGFSPQGFLKFQINPGLDEKFELRGSLKKREKGIVASVAGLVKWFGLKYVAFLEYRLRRRFQMKFILSGDEQTGFYD